ncbi:unnamed protein product [Kuraishia capsulata CBS 1993]|uniref:OPT family small oligopeptide transporter n=1 Tax=Kuraishia capsulata CBS 1993 TaxID=1382522 RepID=W6MF42_9ASCO|nr:uncharacterized protein KUCA_T00000194001 [Kuraishia capsulata CBS 1993]CDK24234.1 unnamed protein product [Kuraishia capsulata CBS 1993]
MEKDKHTVFAQEVELEEGAIHRLTSVQSASSVFDPLANMLSKQVEEDAYAQMHIEDDSPYAEVRAAVPSTDDTSMPQNTWRVWVLGMLMATIGAGMDMILALHSPQFFLSTFVVSVLVWPLGRAWEKVMPNIKVLGLPLNPGPFNIKEHALITIMANIAFGNGQAYATDIVMVLNLHYNTFFGWGFNLCIVWATQCLGFAFAGLMRKILVEPSNMIWPSTLVTSTFLTNIHINDNHVANGWKISRLKFFLIVFAASFAWYWFPGYVFQALSYFAWPTWIAPNNVIVNQVFGAYSGIGLFPITFDWEQIAGYTGSPLVPPLSTIFSVAASMVVMYWIITPAIHYANVLYFQYLPISSSSTYDRYQNTYNVTKIINSDLSFNLEKYKAYSPLFLSTTFFISYGMSFASFTATIVHAYLFHGADIWHTLRHWDNANPDVHYRLMKSYRGVPEWWYCIVFAIFFALAIVAVRAWNTEMPVYALVISILLAMFMLIPIGVVYAISNIEIALNVVTEFIIGYMVPGKPASMMIFKTFGFIVNLQALTFAQDMKLGQYMKLSPRLLFACQLFSGVWGGLVNCAVMKWAQGNIVDVCQSTQKNNFTCPGIRVFFNASIIWGVIGPTRLFSEGQLYYGVLFFFLIGAALPVVNWLVLRKYPNSWVKYINWPVFFGGSSSIPPATPYNYATYCTVGIIFNYFIKKRWFHWWSKYNFSLSAGLDLGLAWASMMIFLCLDLTNADYISWWGNNITYDTMDMTKTAIRVVLAEGEGFGPTSW